MREGGIAEVERAKADGRRDQIIDRSTSNPAPRVGGSHLPRELARRGTHFRAGTLLSTRVSGPGAPCPSAPPSRGVR